MKFLLALILVAAVSAQNPLPLSSFINDNYVLNYALTLENFERELYRRAAASFNSTSFTNAGFNSTTYDYLTTLAAQESVHASAINATLISRGWPPVQPCTYNFPAGIFTNVRSFLNFTATIEQTGVSAYDGAVPYISDPALLEFAATVATVEARHSAVLFQIIGQNFSANALEPTLSPAQVVANTAQYLGNCPSTVLATGYNGTVTANSSALPLPQPANATRQLNTTFATVSAPQVNITNASRLNDDRVLNYALTALQFVDAFLNFSLTGNGTTPAPVNASSLAAAGYSPSVLPGLLTILSQNTAQVAAVRLVIASRGQTPVAPCIYSFPANVTSVAAFWPLAVTFENVSVQAFDGGIRAITDSSLALTAATIATVEGRHSAFLNNASGLASPFPSPYDGVLTPNQTFALLRPFILSCPTTNVETGSNATITSLNATLPSYLNYFGQSNQTLSNQAPSGNLVINPATPFNSTGGNNNVTENTPAAGPTNWASTLTVSALVMGAIMLFV